KSRRRCCSAATSSSESVHEITPKFPPPRHVEKKDKGSIEEESEESEDEWVEVDSDEDLEDMDEDDEEEGSGKDMNEDDDIEFELDQTCCLMCHKKHKTIEKCMVHMQLTPKELSGISNSFARRAIISTLSNPAIAIAAALSLAVEVSNFSDFDGSSADAVAFLEKKLDYLVSRAELFCFSVENMLEDDVASNKAIETFGSSLMRQQAKNPDKLSVLTHCNTGRKDSTRSYIPVNIDLIQIKSQ
uniref:Uncharacterized protein n=1 Tax=Brassica oleracea var. oleracea TaxID=109376 RepID=A0A0D3CXM0_BRAOL